MTRKPPPEGARWTIPDWSPDASAHEQEVMQYLDQLEMLRRDLAREREALKAKESDIAMLKQQLEREKAVPRESAENTKRAEDNVKLLRAQQNIINDLEASIASITTEKTALEQKLKSKSTPLTFWENAGFTALFLLVGVSILHSLYAIGSWGWAAMTAPSQSQEEARIEKAALQCALKQRALAEGRPANPLGPEDTLRPLPAALKPAPSNFLAVGDAARNESWRGATFKTGKIDLERFGWGGYLLTIGGVLINQSQNQIHAMTGDWYIIGLRGSSLECEPISYGGIYKSDLSLGPGRSLQFEYKEEHPIEADQDEDLIVRAFAEFHPVFLEDSR